MKKSYKHNKFKLSRPAWTEKCELIDTSYSVLDTQDYFEYIIKKHETFTDNPPIRIYINKIENWIIIEIKKWYYIQLLTSETMELFRSTKNKITKDENGEYLPNLEITEVVLVHCNIANNDYQQDSRVLKTIVSIKSFGQLLDISPKHFVFINTFNSVFSYISN